MAKKKTSSMLIYQVVEGMRHRDCSLEQLAGVAKITPQQLVSWLYDDGEPYPTLDVIERLMSILRMVPVYVPAEEKETSVRDVLDEVEMAIFDSAPDSPPEVLRYQLHDLALQRYRLEQGYAEGVVPDKLYHTLLLKLAEATRFAAETLTKVEAVAKQSLDGDAEVEIVYKEEEPVAKAKPLELADLADEDEIIPEAPPTPRRSEEDNEK